MAFGPSCELDISRLAPVLGRDASRVGINPKIIGTGLVCVPKSKKAITRKYFTYYANVSSYFETEEGGVGR